MEFWEIILNGLEPVMFWALLFVAYFGLIVNVAFDIAKRKPESRTSPKTFEWNYFWLDNWRRLMSSIIVIPAGVVLFTYLTGEDLNIGNAFMIGFGVDKLIEILKHKKVL